MHREFGVVDERRSTVLQIRISKSIFRPDLQDNADKRKRWTEHTEQCRAQFYLQPYN